MSQSNTRTGMGDENSCRSVTNISCKSRLQTINLPMDLSMIIDQEIFKNEGEMDRLLYHLLVVELLSDKFIFTEGEPGLTGH